MRDDDNVPFPRAPCLREKRHVINDNGPGVVDEGLTEPSLSLISDSGMDNTVQLSQAAVVREDDGAERAAIQCSVIADDARSEGLDDRRENCLSWLLKITHDLIGVNNDGPVRCQPAGDRGFPRGDASCDCDEHHGDHGMRPQALEGRRMGPDPEGSGPISTTV